MSARVASEARSVRAFFAARGCTRRLRSKWWSCTAHPGSHGSSRAVVWAGDTRFSNPARLLISRRGIASAAGRGYVPSALGLSL
eukprot:8459016-Alexandrium_andersonii.AAC.1